MQLTTLERLFINTCQGNFPLETDPFKLVAKQLGCDTNELITTARKLKTDKYLTRFGPLYNASRLGGGLTLAALCVPQERYASVTERVNAYPEVAHNYQREHKLNMWFVLATETPQEVKKVLTSIENTCGLKVYNFPKQQEFYIGLWLHLSSSGQISTMPVPYNLNNSQCIEAHDYRIDDIDRKLIRATQTGLPIESTPYRTVANNIGLSEMAVLQRLKKMLAHGLIRRIGAVPNHYKLGLTANGMTVWQVKENRLLETGNVIGRLNFVSHCYQRPRHLPLWPYNLFAMVHGHCPDEVKEKTQKIKELLGDNCLSSDILFSSAILKKTGMRIAA